jgi:hypothetical protein
MVGWWGFLEVRWRVGGGEWRAIIQLGDQKSVAKNKDNWVEMFFPVSDICVCGVVKMWFVELRGSRND